ncbi:MAG: XRE family transcriptional regulator [Porphyromonadaceae bacterium]|nr:XRE family transcriptional regulator [Porphyromonadaceae bacterium]
MNRIGERIKKKREMHKLNLNELAGKVGISPSALSQIEKSKSFPSIVTLKSIAENLHTTVGELMGENEAIANNPVVLRNEMKLTDQNRSGTNIYLLSHNDTNKQMDTYLVRFAKTSGMENLLSDSHGQVFCHVLSGEIRFQIEEKTHLLKQGDSIYFNVRSSKEAVNNADGISEMLWIQSPANF